MKHIKIGSRLAALILVLALLLTGCAAPAGSSADTPAEPTGSAAAPATEPAESESAAESDEPDHTSEDPLSEEELALLQRTGLMEGEAIEISEEEASEINRAVAGMWAGYVAGPNGEDPLVKSRDWSIYSSSLGQENLSKREAELFKRLDKVCLKYLSTSSLDGVKKRNSDGTVYYVTDGAKFSDLGLSKDQALNVYFWFRYNNPQYYFLASRVSRSSDCLYGFMYETMADGKDRAEITNQLFDKLDGWIQDVEDNASTAYEKELYANNLLCMENKYERQYEKPLEDGLRYDQSLYSSVLLGKTVCTGYAMAFCAMMNAMGIDTTTGVSSNHAWNVVRYDDGNYYAVDVCWNDTDSNPPYNNEYLNIGEEIMSRTNSRKESHTYDKYYAAWIPAIAKTSYAPTREEMTLAAPQNVQVKATSAASISFAWDMVPGASKYRVTRFEDSKYTKAADSTTVSKTEYTFNNLQPDTTYYFGVSACQMTGLQEPCSDWTYFSQKTGSDEGSTQPIIEDNPITGLGTRWAGTNHAITKWTLPWEFAKHGKYEVCQYTDSTYTEMVEGYPCASKSDNSHTWAGLEPGKTYYFGVRGVETIDGVTAYSHWMNFSYTHTEAP